MKIVWLPKAIANLESVKHHIAKDNPQAARNVAQKIQQTVSLIHDHPYIGKPTELPDILEKQVADLPYLIPYQIVHDELHILRIFHESQEKPNSWL
jgi:toxin ParE1/3/4